MAVNDDVGKMSSFVTRVFDSMMKLEVFFGPRFRLQGYAVDVPGDCDVVQVARYEAYTFLRSTHSERVMRSWNICLGRKKIFLRCATM